MPNIPKSNGAPRPGPRGFLACIIVIIQKNSSHFFKKMANNLAHGGRRWQPARRMMKKHPVFLESRLWAALACALWAGTARGASGETNTFGFTGPEVYPMDNAVTLLHAADMDGDGLNDLIVVNNARSKINILYNRTGKTNTPPEEEGLKKEINQLPPDARFNITSIATEKRIFALVVADLNGDGRPDLAYYGDPKELVVQYNLGTNGWSAPKRFPIDDGQLGPNALATGRPPRRADAPAWCCWAKTISITSPKMRTSLLAEPEKIPFSGAVNSLQVLDINGDGRDDLLLVNFQSPDPFRFRLQDAQGQLGPEIHFTFPAVRAWLADDLLGDHKMELITIAQNSGRARISGLESQAGRAALRRFQERPIPGVAPEQNIRAPPGHFVGGCQRRRPRRFAGGGAGQRAIDALSATGRRHPRPGQNLSRP